MAAPSDYKNLYQYEKAKFGSSTDMVPVYRPQDSHPRYLDVSSIIKTVQAAAYATKNLGVSSYALESLPARIAQEGRADAGANKFDHNDKRSVQVYEALQAAGHEYGATYAAAMVGAEKRAAHYKTSTERAYNGLGESQLGRTGQDYAQDMSRMLTAVPADPRNAQFMDLVNRAATGRLTPVQQDLITSYEDDPIWKRSGRHIADARYLLPDNKREAVETAENRGFNLAMYVTYRDRKLRGANDFNTEVAAHWEKLFPEATAAGETVRRQLGQEIATKEAPAPQQDSLLDTIRNFAKQLGI